MHVALVIWRCSNQLGDGDYRGSAVPTPYMLCPHCPSFEVCAQVISIIHQISRNWILMLYMVCCIFERCIYSETELNNTVHLSIIIYHSNLFSSVIYSKRSCCFRSCEYLMYGCVFYENFACLNSHLCLFNFMPYISNFMNIYDMSEDTNKCSIHVKVKWEAKVDAVSVSYFPLHQMHQWGYWQPHDLQVSESERILWWQCPQVSPPRQKSKQDIYFAISTGKQVLKSSPYKNDGPSSQE